MDDIAKIAAGLSEAQRRLVLASEPGAFGRDDTSCGAEVWTGGEHMAALALERKGVGNLCRYAHGMCSLYFNTNTTGLAVRTYLMETQNG